MTASAGDSVVALLEPLGESKSLGVLNLERTQVSSASGFTVGRGKEPDGTVPCMAKVHAAIGINNRISRKHFAVLYKNGKFFVRDWSKYGTQINGATIKAKSVAPLTSGDRIGVHITEDTKSTSIQFRFRETPGGPAAAKAAAKAAAALAAGKEKAPLATGSTRKRQRSSSVASSTSSAADSEKPPATKKPRPSESPKRPGRLAAASKPALAPPPAAKRPRRSSRSRSRASQSSDDEASPDASLPLAALAKKSESKPSAAPADKSPPAKKKTASPPAAKTAAGAASGAAGAAAPAEAPGQPLGPPRPIPRRGASSSSSRSTNAATNPASTPAAGALRNPIASGSARPKRPSFPAIIQYGVDRNVVPFAGMIPYSLSEFQSVLGVDRCTVDVVLDLDGTVILNTVDASKLSDSNAFVSDFELPASHGPKIGVLVRPGLDAFMQFLVAEGFRVSVCTQSDKDYAMKVVDTLVETKFTSQHSFSLLERLRERVVAEAAPGESPGPALPHPTTWELNTRLRVARDNFGQTIPKTMAMFDALPMNTRLATVLEDRPGVWMPEDESKHVMVIRRQTVSTSHDDLVSVAMMLYEARRRALSRAVGIFNNEVEKVPNGSEKELRGLLDWVFDHLDFMSAAHQLRYECPWAWQKVAGVNISSAGRESAKTEAARVMRAAGAKSAARGGSERGASGSSAHAASNGHARPAPLRDSRPRDPRRQPHSHSQQQRHTHYQQPPPPQHYPTAGGNRHPQPPPQQHQPPTLHPPGHHRPRREHSPKHKIRFM